MSKNTLITILVASCDKYCDVLEPFSILFRKYWPDCPGEVVLVCESRPKEPVATRFDRVIACGSGLTWSARLMQALGAIHTDHVFMMCDDYFLEAPVKTAAFLERVALAHRVHALNLRLLPNPVPELAFPEDPTIREYRKNTAYCISTLCGVWNRDFLLEQARCYASIWEFERFGSFSFKVDEKRPILGCLKKEFPFVDAVHKGCWERFGLEVCRANGVDVDLETRGLPRFSTCCLEWGKSLVFRLVSPTLIVRLQNSLHLGAKERK